MEPRRLSRIAAGGLTFAAVLGTAVPAYAEVGYDPGKKTGFVGAADLKAAFGWDDATLAERATGVEFEQNYWERDNYDMTCGGGPVFPIAHPKVGARYDLLDVVTRDDSGYGKVSGFRITGSHRGVSGTSYLPGVGEPCPDGEGATTVTSKVLTSSEAGWSLVANSGDDSRELLTGTSAVSARLREIMGNTRPPRWRDSAA
jgi:hypothetical protein